MNPPWRYLEDALLRLNRAEPLKETMGERFVDLLTSGKPAEFAAYHKVISAWERESLPLNV